VKKNSNGRPQSRGRRQKPKRYATAPLEPLRSKLNGLRAEHKQPVATKPLPHVQRVEVRALILDGRGRILLIRRSKSDAFLPGRYELPGGRVEFLESPTAALYRELRQETDLKVAQILRIISVHPFLRLSDSQLKQYFSVTYMVDVEAGEIHLSDEHGEFIWVDPEQTSLRLIPLTPSTEVVVRILNRGKTKDFW